MFLRKTTKERTPASVTMTGVRMGERLLQIGMGESAAVGAIAAKVGLSGSAAWAVAEEASAEKARRAAASAGALVDVRVTPLDLLPFPDEGFDVVVVHDLRGLIGLGAPARAAALVQCHRVLRGGGRIIAVEPGAHRGFLGQFGALLRQPERAQAGAAGGTMALLEAAGFRPVRVVGELDGFTFTEGLKPASH